MEVCVRPLLLLTAVITVSSFVGTSLAATTPFRFPANLAEAFRTDGAKQEKRGLTEVTDDARQGNGRTSGPTSGRTSGSGFNSGGRWRAEREPASARQYSDGNSQSYGTSWNNHYQSPTKSSSYDSRYDAPERGGSNRYDDEGRRQYNYQDSDSDSGSYHSETPYGGGSYSGGTYHSGGGNYQGGGRNDYRGDEDHYSDGRDHYGGGGSNYGGRYENEGGDEYGGGRNYNDEVTSYTRGDNHYGDDDVGRNDYDGDRNHYGSSRNHYDRGRNHYGGDDSYERDNRDDEYGPHGQGHGGHRGHDYGHGGHEHDYRGSGRGSSGHSEDPIDEYAVYSPKMSGTYRRRSDGSEKSDYRGALYNLPEPLPGAPFDRSDARLLNYNRKRQEETPPEDQGHVGAVDRKDEFENFSRKKKTQTLLDMINQRTEEAFGQPGSQQTAANIGGKGRRDFTGFGSYDNSVDSAKPYGGYQDSELPPSRHQEFQGDLGFVREYFGNGDKGDKMEAKYQHPTLRRPAGFEDFQEPEGLYEQPRYEAQKHLKDDDSSNDFGGFRIPDHIFGGDAFVDQRPGKYPTEKPPSYGADQGNDDGFFNRGHDRHQPAKSGSEDSVSQFDIRVNDMFAKISNPFQSQGPEDSERTSKNSTPSGHPQKSDTMPHRSRYQEVEAMAREATDLPVIPKEESNASLNETERKLVHNRTRRNTSASDDSQLSFRSSEGLDARSNDELKLSKSKESEPREVHPVIHRHFDGVPHMIHRDMGDEVKSESSAEPPVESTGRDGRRFRFRFHGPRATAFRRPGRRVPTNFSAQRSRHGGTPLYPPLRGFSPPETLGHRQRQKNRGAIRPFFPAPGQLPLQREQGGFNGRPNPQLQRQNPQQHGPSPQNNPLHSNFHQAQLRHPLSGQLHPASFEHQAVSFPTTTTERTPAHGHPAPFPVQHGPPAPYQSTPAGITVPRQPHTANNFFDGPVPITRHETTTVSSAINVQSKQQDQRLTDNLVEVDGGYGVFKTRKHSQPGSVDEFHFLDAISQASNIGENRRQDEETITPGFKPGVLEHGFLPILPPKHHITRRDLSDDTIQVNAPVTSNNRPADSRKSSKSTDTRFLPAVFPGTPSDLLQFQVDPLTSKHTLDAKSSLASPRIPTIQAKPLTSSSHLQNTLSNTDSSPKNISTSSSHVKFQANSTQPSDLALAGSHSRTAYEPYYSNYKGRHGYRNYRTQKDPYQRYLPTEDNKDPYFRYASRGNIRHSHDDEAPPEEDDRRLEQHRQHDLYGRRSSQRRPRGPDRHRRTERPETDYDDNYDRERPRYGVERRKTTGYGPGYDTDYADPSYDDRTYRDESHGKGRQNDYDYDDGDYDSDYNDYGGHDGHSNGDNGYSDDEHNNGYHSDSAEDGYHGEDGGRRRGGRRRNRHRYQRYYDPGYQSGRYKEGERTDYYGAHGDERIRDIDGEIRDEASRGYDDSRRTVTAMLDTMAQKRGDANCKEVAKDGMTCFQCTDAKGFQTEDCAYASNSKDPDNQHVSYSESSSYGDSKRRGYDKRGKLRRTPVRKHQRGGDIFDPSGSSERELDKAAADGGDSYGDPLDPLDGGSSQGRSEELHGEEETRSGRLQTPGAFRAGRFRDAYPRRIHSRGKRHAGSGSPASTHGALGRRGSDHNTDDSYTGRALARFLKDDANHHDEVGPSETASRRSWRGTPEERAVPRYHAEQGPSAQRRSGGYHVRGVVPEYHRTVESSQSSGGRYNEYAAGDAQRRPAHSENGGEVYDDARDEDSETIGDLFDFRFNKRPIDGRFVERLQQEREDAPQAEYEYDYGDSEYDDQEARDYPEYDYDYQEQGRPYEHQEQPSGGGSPRTSDSSSRSADYEDDPSTPLRSGEGRARRQRARSDARPSYNDDGAATYDDADRHERRSADKRDNSAEERERARDLEPLSDDEPAAYETHSYDRPDITRSYEVSTQRRPSLTDDLGTPRGYLHSDRSAADPRSERQEPRDGTSVRYDRAETYDRLNRGSAMTQQYRDPGREFFRSHPAGFEHFPTFDYVESDKTTK